MFYLRYERNENSEEQWIGGGRVISSQPRVILIIGQVLVRIHFWDISLFLPCLWSVVSSERGHTGVLSVGQGERWRDQGQGPGMTLTRLAWERKMSGKHNAWQRRRWLCQCYRLFEIKTNVMICVMWCDGWISCHGFNFYKCLSWHIMYFMRSPRARMLTFTNLDYRTCTEENIEGSSHVTKRILKHIKYAGWVCKNNNVCISPTGRSI